MMTTVLKMLVAYGGPAVLAAFAAWWLTADYYQQQRAEYEKAVTAERLEQKRQDYEKLVAVQNELDALRGERVRLSADLERMRKAYADRSRRTSDAACGMEREAVARCEGLLRESADLLAEGGNLLQGNAELHDALSEYTSGKVEAGKSR